LAAKAARTLLVHLCLPGASEGARCLLNKVKAELDERTEIWKTAQHMFTLQADHDAAELLKPLKVPIYEDDYRIARTVSR
jgi:hypothetical protein